MNILLSRKRARVSAQTRPFGLADQILSDIADYDFDLESVRSYDQPVQEEISAAVNDLRSIRGLRTRPHLWKSTRRTADIAMSATDPIERDQSVWSLIAGNPKRAAEPLIRSVCTAPTRELAISALLALHKVAHHELGRTAGFLRELAGGADVELAEWARLHLLEIAAAQSGSLEVLHEPVSARDFVYQEGAIFDVTMPLIFHCDAYTRVGPATLHTVVSPAWFATIFGRAMACVCQATFSTRLVLEKLVAGLHDDGSPHFEHFPFSGTTTSLSARVHRHNYWAQLHRPFYTSGRTEVVSEDRPVISRVPMTFCRLACTYTPEKYDVRQRPIPESVRGMFFGYGHIEPRVLLESGFQLRVGDFQLSSRINPATGRPANTCFYGTFFGKLSDWDGDGKLDVNTRPVHCNREGRLDYRGDGAMAPDPVRPNDWL